MSSDRTIGTLTLKRLTMLTNFHVSIIKFNTDNIENNSNNMKQNMSISIGRKGVISSKSEKKRFMEVRLDSIISFTILPKTKRNILVNNLKGV